MGTWGILRMVNSTNLNVKEAVSRIMDSIHKVKTNETSEMEMSIKTTHDYV